jgi:hypothetical protein
LSVDIVIIPKRGFMPAYFVFIFKIGIKKSQLIPPMACFDSTNKSFFPNAAVARSCLE